MSEIAASLPPGMRPDAAQRRIAAFTKRFGEAHLYLAYHAAFPLALTPDLLYRLRANFQRDIYGKALNIPWIAVADLLLSSLCEEVGYEHYEMKVAVRHELLNQLKADERFGPQRITELSNFLIKYVRQQLDSHDPDVRDFAQAQYWTALVATRPEEAAHSIALTLSKLDARDRAEFARMRSLIEMFGEPSQEFTTLLSYVKSMEQYARGDEEGARIGLERVAGSGQAVGVHGVELPVPENLRPLVGGVNELSISATLKVDEVPVLKDCFISYHPADYMWAEWIAWEIEEAGYSVVLQDAANFEFASDFVREMEKASRVAKNIVALYSGDYIDVLTRGQKNVFGRTPTAFVLSLPDGRQISLQAIRVGEYDSDALPVVTEYDSGALPVLTASYDLVGLNEQEAHGVINDLVHMYLTGPDYLPKVNREVVHTVAEKPVFPGLLLRTQVSPRVSANPCPYCGAATLPEDNFCLNCGNRLPTTSPPGKTEPVGDVSTPVEDDWNRPFQSPNASAGSSLPQKEAVLSNAIVQESVESRIGQQFGDYRLVRLLARVASASIYLGEYAHIVEKPVAVEVWNTPLIKQEEQERFRAEADIIARLRHPHIVQVLGFGVRESDSIPFLIKEYVPNSTLFRLHPRGTPLPIGTVVRYTKQIAGALQYAHNHSVIHRDVRPWNMLLGSNNEIVLTDFAIPVLSGSTPYEVLSEKQPGYVPYIAPEQIQGKTSFASDQYSLAIVIYEWLTGTLPFRGSFDEVATQHVLVSPKPLRELVPTISQAVEQVVLKALAKDPKNRFVTVEAFTAALERAWLEASSQTQVAVSSAPTQKTGEDNRSRLGPGTIVAERYKIEKMVALGGLVAVYRAVDMHFNGPCAIKEIIDELQSDEERWRAVEWFQSKMTSMLNLNHPGIPRVYSFFQRGIRHYIVMEWIEGRTLSGVLEKEGNIAGVGGALGVTEVRAQNWAQQLCSVLEYLHRQSPAIIFRVLRPVNVMVTERDEIRLVDFDIAHMFQRQSSRETPQVSGDFGYTPPEQLEGNPRRRSDIYALGATLHRMLTHHNAADNKPDIFTFPSIRALRPDVSPGFEQVVMKALEPDLEKRWASAAEMERAILNLPPVIRDSNTPVQVPSQQPWPQEGTGPASGFISSAQASITAHSLEDAYTAIQQAYALEPNNAVVRKIFGQIFARRQPPNIDMALRAYNRSLELNPNDAETHKLLGDVRFFLQKQPAQAIPHYRDSLRLNVNDAGTHYRLAQCYQQTDQLDDALGEYQEAVRLAPNSPSMQFALAQLARSMKKLSIAKWAFVRVLTLNPGDYATRFLLCQVYEEEGELENAYRECGYVVQGMPENKEAKKMLERLRRRLRK